MSIVAALLVLSTQVAEPTPEVVYAKKTVIALDEVTVTGEFARPLASFVRARRRVSFEPRLLLRTDFFPELLNTTEALP